MRTADAFRQHGAVLLQAPTGVGKTVCGAAIAQRARAKGKAVTFAVHRRNLIRQTAQTMGDFDVPYGYIAAGFSPSNELIQIASIDTLRNRLERLPAPDLLVVDECHMAAAATWRRVVQYYRDQGARVLGLTATPTRLDGKSLRDLFDHMVLGPEPAWLIENGYLSRYEAYAPSTPDLEGVRTRMGDFDRQQLTRAVDKPTITGDAAHHYRRLAFGTRAICYCTSIEHSQHAVDHFREAGIPAAHIDGKTPRDEQQRIIEAFANGHYMVLSNCELVTTGFDLSAQVGREVPVETIIMLRPTQSEALALQMLGRGLRRKPKPAIILDHSGNLLRHGLPDMERAWSLDPKQKRKHNNEQTVSIKQCPQCYFTHLPRPICPQCGYIYPVEPREIEVVDGELTRIDIEAMKRQQRAEQGRAQTLDQLEAIGRTRGYKKPRAWAHFVLKARQAKQAERARRSAA